MLSLWLIRTVFLGISFLEFGSVECPANGSIYYHGCYSDFNSLLQLCTFLCYVVLDVLSYLSWNSSLTWYLWCGNIVILCNVAELFTSVSCCRTFVMPSRMCINPIHNKKGILHHSDNRSSEERWVQWDFFCLLVSEENALLLSICYLPCCQEPCSLEALSSLLYEEDPPAPTFCNKWIIKRMLLSLHIFFSLFFFYLLWIWKVLEKMPSRFGFVHAVCLYFLLMYTVIINQKSKLIYNLNWLPLIW